MDTPIPIRRTKTLVFVFSLILSATPRLVSVADADFSMISLPTGKSSYSLPSQQEQIMTELYKNGPVEAAFDVYADFLNYKTGENCFNICLNHLNRTRVLMLNVAVGVYQHVTGEMLGGHAIKILGWGEENGTPYWLAANSWNEDWGDHG